jgi:signal transduction histidine kinase
MCYSAAPEHGQCARADLNESGRASDNALRSRARLAVILISTGEMNFRADNKLCLIALVALLIPCGFARAATEPDAQQVLILQSFARGNLILDHLTSNLRVDMVKGSERPLNFVQISVGPTGFISASDLATVDFIRATYANGPKPDLIVTIAAPAAQFARKYRQQLFPDTPLVFASVDQRLLGDSPLMDNEAPISVLNDFPQVVDDILQVLPATRQIFMVMGAGPIGKLWHQELEIQFERFKDRVTFVWSDDLTLAQLLERAAHLPDHSVIYYFTFATDSLGTAYADERVVADLHSVANAPLFSAHSVYLGHGILGSARLSIDDASRRAASAAVRILNGEPPINFRAPPQLPGSPAFDWRELERWKIPASRLPQDSVVLFREPTLWQKHRFMLLFSAGVLLVQALLIVWLLFERRARQRAEIESRKNLSLAADAHRREMMSVLGTAFAHDLAQPVSSIMCNAEALLVMGKRDLSIPEDLREILTDIQADSVRSAQIIDRYRKMLRGHQLSKKTVDLRLALQESLALVSHEVRTRRIEVISELPPSPCMVNCDYVLMQQVLVNLLMNAIDAMSETQQTQARLKLKCEPVSGGVQVSVQDTGRGLSAELMDSLFTPFFTTKSQGLGVGLTIVQSILQAHGGSITARNNPDQIGATFLFTLPTGNSSATRLDAPDHIDAVSC